MANKPIKIKINVLKIDKRHLYVGAKGTYLDCAVWPNRDGPDERGMTHYIVQEISKEARDAGEKGAIIGNLKIEAPPADKDFSRPPEKPPAKVANTQAFDEEDDIPF